jgi:hypothetical protein
MWYTDAYLPYLNQKARVTVGAIMFESVNAIEITESVSQLSDTAKVILPRFFEMLEGKYPLDYMNAGDKVLIEYGYEETGINIEFEGYLGTISSDVPLELTCDQLYPLRQNNHIKSYKAATLRQVLADVTKGTIVKRFECPDVQLGKYMIDNKSTYQVLDDIKEKFGFFARFNDGVLYVGFAWDWRPGITRTHIYNIVGNVKKNNLIYKTRDQFNVRVRVKIRNAKGKAAYIEAGSKNKDATVHTIEYAASSEAVAKQIADARLKKSVYDGYTGDITGFGLLLTKAGDTLTINDDREPYRAGSYLIEKVVKSYDDGGISRKNDLAFKV